MGNKQSELLRIILLLTDFLQVNIAYLFSFVALLWKNADYIKDFGFTDYVFFNCSWFLLAFLFRLYSYEILAHIENIFRKTWRTILTHGIVFFLYAYLISHNAYSKNFVLVCYSLLVTSFVASRFLLTYMVEFVMNRIKLRQNVAIVGYNEQGLRLAEYFNSNKGFYSFEGFFDDGRAYSSGNHKGRIVSSINDCIPFVLGNNIREIYSTILPDEHVHVRRLVEAAEDNCVKVRFVPKAGADSATNYYFLGHFDNMPVISLRAEPLDSFVNRVKKRVFDIVVSSFVIVCILPWLTPLLAVLIKLDSRGPVFFRQKRSGRENKPFWCLKFRSMMNNQNEEQQATKDDARITRIGRWMRSTSIDELPQFFNVLTGSMSVVGPRPHMLQHTQQYSSIVDKFMVRHLSKPGISGWAQVNGYRGETETSFLMQKRVEYDLWYLSHWSLMLDVKIVFMTIIHILKTQVRAY